MLLQHENLAVRVDLGLAADVNFLAGRDLMWTCGLRALSDKNKSNPSSLLCKYITW